MSVFDIDFGKKQPLGFHPHLKANFQKFISNKAYLVVTLFFFIVVVSGINSTDFGYWGERLRIKLPFILLPFAFASMPRFRKKDYLTIFYFFLIILFGSTLLVGLDYWINYEKITDGLGRGRPIPTPVNHIRYSLMIAFGTIGGIVLWYRNFHWKYLWEKWLIIGMTGFLFFFLHVLSVRSGLLVLYASLIFLSFRYAYLEKKYTIGILSAIQ